MAGLTMIMRKNGDVVVLEFKEIDLEDTRRITTLVENLVKLDGEKKIVVDLSQVDNLYSIQIGTLVSLHVLCYENVAIMKLANANEKVKNLLRMVGLDKLMEMHHGVDVAAQSFGGKS